MRENGCFVTPGSDVSSQSQVKEILDFYTQTCNITVNTSALSIMAATLANGGICPLTGDKVLSNNSVKPTLATMQASGMNEYSVNIFSKISLQNSWAAEITSVFVNIFCNFQIETIIYYNKL
jgi:hypothetical protein